MRAGVVDLALIGAAGEPPPGLDALPIVSERLVAAVPSGYPFAHRSVVTLAEVVEYPIVCMPTGTGIRTAFDRACASAGLRPTVAPQASAPGTVADLATRGLGIAILSESMTAPYGTSLTSAVIDDVDIPAVLALIWRTPTGPALREMLRLQSSGLRQRGAQGRESVTFRPNGRLTEGLVDSPGDAMARAG